MNNFLSLTGLASSIPVEAPIVESDDDEEVAEDAME